MLMVTVCHACPLGTQLLLQDHIYTAIFHLWSSPGYTESLVWEEKAVGCSK